MSNEAFLLTLASGAALLALWFAMRYPGLGPASLGGAFLHVAVAMLVGTGLAPTTSLVAAGIGAFVAVFTVALPAFTYMFLAGIWLARVAVQTLPH
jgi:hypothetical protein